MASKMSKADIQNQINKLSLAELRDINVQYSKQHNLSLDKSMTILLTQDLQNRIIELGINQECPECGSKQIKKHGTRNGVQRYECTKCHKSFTPFTNTFLEKTKWHWEMWIEVIYCMLNNISIESTKLNLINNFQIPSIETKTIFNWRHKILDAAKNVPLPTLTGVIQIDETHFHEAQKGSRSLENYYDETKARHPRKRAKSSKYGVMGAEFSTVICAVDETGHVISKVSGLGKFDIDMFKQLMSPFISSARIICTDANNVYLTYSAEYNLVHYVRPSNYLDIKRKYYHKSDEWLYEHEMIDFMAHQNMTYAKFSKFVTDNNLNLSRVNGYHSALTTFINEFMHGVSTKHLESYVAWFDMLTNFRIDNGHKPVTKKDAEDILIMLLKTKNNLLVKDLQTKQMILPKPNKTYLKNLAKNTDKVRKSGLANSFFRFNEEDKTADFTKREIVDNLNLTELKEMCKFCGIKGYGKIKKDCTYKWRRELEKHPKYDDAIKMMWAKKI